MPIFPIQRIPINGLFSQGLLLRLVELAFLPPASFGREIFPRGRGVAGGADLKNRKKKIIKIFKQKTKSKL